MALESELVPRTAAESVAETVVELAPIRRSSLSADIAEDLRRRILGGEIPPGTRLPAERTLAAQLGTNRNTLREALRVLESQGLVRVRHGDGISVQDPRVHGTLELVAPFVLEGADPNQRLQVLADALRVRRFLASEAARACAEQDGEGTAHALGRALDAVLAADGNPSAKAERDLELFAVLIDRSGRLLYRWALNAILGACRGFIERAPGIWWFPPDYESSWRAVAGAVAGGHGDQAAELVDAYFQRNDEALGALSGGAL